MNEQDRKEVNQNPHMYVVLGELKSDIGHVLNAIKVARGDTAQVREELIGLRTEFREENTKLNDRLTKVERFNTRFAAYATVALVFLTAFVNWAVPELVTNLWNFIGK